MKIKIFYGWYMVTAAVIISAFIGGGTYFGFTALINPITATFGWSYAQISLAMSIRAGESGALDPFVGKAADRWPAKWLILIGVAIVGLGYLLLSQVNNLAVFYISFMIVALGSALCSGITPTVTIARWFRGNFGKASGLLAFGGGLGGMMTPALIKLIDAYGWRTSVIILAVVMCLVGIPLSFVFRSRPEDYGALPDGEPRSSSKVPAGAEVYDFGVGVAQALKMRSFWQFGLASMLQMAGASAATLHMVPYLTSVGIERSFAGTIAMLVPMLSLGARLVFGWLADILQKKYVYAASIALTGTGLFFYSLIDISSPALIFPFIILFGLGIGGIMPVRAPTVREYFGINNFGTIYGLQMVFMTIGMMTSPPLAGWVFDVRGSYYPVWLILGAAAGVGVLLMLTMPSPSRPSRTPPVPQR